LQFANVEFPFLDVQQRSLMNELTASSGNLPLTLESRFLVKEHKDGPSARHAAKRQHPHKQRILPNLQDFWRAPLDSPDLHRSAPVRGVFASQQLGRKEPSESPGEPLPIIHEQESLTVGSLFVKSRATSGTA
jgi:hypothetical protein